MGIFSIDAVRFGVNCTDKSIIMDTLRHDWLMYSIVVTLLIFSNHKSRIDINFHSLQSLIDTVIGYSMRIKNSTFHKNDKTIHKKISLYSFSSATSSRFRLNTRFLLCK